MARKTKRYEFLDNLEVNKESFLREDPSIILIIMK